MLNIAKGVPAMPGLVVPTVNLNGSSKKDLVNQHIAIQSAFEELSKAIRAGMPHGRDYQTMGFINGQEPCIAARRAYEARLKVLNAMAQEFYTVAEKILEQGR